MFEMVYSEKEVAMVIQSWNARDVLKNEKTEQLIKGAATLGVDIGSRQSKAVLLYQDTVYAAITASDVDSKKTADRLLKKLLTHMVLQRLQKYLMISRLWVTNTQPERL